MQEEYYEEKKRPLIAQVWKKHSISHLEQIRNNIALRSLKWYLSQFSSLHWCTMKVSSFLSFWPQDRFNRGHRNSFSSHCLITKVHSNIHDEKTKWLFIFSSWKFHVKIVLKLFIIIFIFSSWLFQKSTKSLRVSKNLSASQSVSQCLKASQSVSKSLKESQRVS